MSTLRLRLAWVWWELGPPKFELQPTGAAVGPACRRRGGRNYHWGQNGATFTSVGMGGQMVTFDEVEGLVIKQSMSVT